MRQLVLNRRRSLFIDAGSTVNLLTPAFGVAALGFQYEEVPDLGRGTAGIIDRQRQVVRVSLAYSAQTRRFTGGHELGHLALHPNADRLHRDFPMDGSTRRLDLPPEEREANYFAACYVMPREEIERSFQARFGKAPLYISDDVANAVCPNEPNSLYDDDPRNTAAILATFKNSRAPVSLAQEYEVSVAAMAYRLVELRLFRD